jgi:PhnB protein
MKTLLNPYLSFRDTARQALEFYQTVFGGKIELHTFQEYHASEDPSEEHKIMHGMIEAENGLTFMAADTPKTMEHRPGNNVSMSLSGDDEKELRRYWEGLSAGANIQEQLFLAPWGDTFGMLTDQFGIQWMVNIRGKAQSA